MANCIYVGTAPAIAQVITLTPGGTWEIGDLITVTFGSKIWSYAVTSATVATFTPLFATAWNALAATDYPEFAEITAASTSTTITLTCDTKGRAIAPVVTTTESDGSAADSQTLSQSTTTANSGPEDWSNAQNWSGGAVPVNSDDVYIDGAIYNGNILYGLDQNAVTVTSLTIRNNYSGYLGLPERNTSGTEYDEYRQTELKIGITTLDVACASGRIKINGQAVQTAVTVRNTGNSADSRMPSLQWRGTNASNTFAIEGGDAGIALKAAETATVLTLRQSGGTLKCSAGTTLTTVSKSAGILTIESATTTLTNDAGDVTINGSGAHTAITSSGGTIYYNSSGTLTAYTGNKQATLSFDGRNVARTVTNATFNDQAGMVDSNRTVSHTNPIQVYGDTIGSRVRCRRQYNITPV